MFAFEIICSSAAPHHLEELRALCVAEWGKIDPFVSAIDGVAIPPPVLAVDEGVLIGGLAFTVYPKPNETDLGLWVNALVVIPKHRGFGIASRLIELAHR